MNREVHWHHGWLSNTPWTLIQLFSQAVVVITQIHLFNLKAGNPFGRVPRGRYTLPIPTRKGCHFSEKLESDPDKLVQAASLACPSFHLQLEESTGECVLLYVLGASSPSASCKDFTMPCGILSPACLISLQHLHEQKIKFPSGKRITTHKHINVKLIFLYWKYTYTVTPLHPP